MDAAVDGADAAVPNRRSEIAARSLAVAGAALTFPWEFYFPAGFLIVLVLAINLVGDGLRDAFDPNTQGRTS